MTPSREHGALALHRDDPGFAGSINIGAMRRHRRLVSAAVFVVGLVVLVAGAVLAQGLPLVGVAVSVLGFVVMVCGSGLFLSGRPGPHTDAGDSDGRLGATRWSRMEDRFRRRFEHLDE